MKSWSKVQEKEQTFALIHLGKKVRLKPKRGRNRSGSINSPVTK